MVLPKRMARFNKIVTNRLTRTFAGRAPGFGIVHHQGRKSGKQYATPVNVFPTAEGYAIALTYGPGTDWVKNVLAAGGSNLEVRGHTVKLTNPRLVHDETHRRTPPGVRQFLGLTGVNDFLDQTTAS